MKIYIILITLLLGFTSCKEELKPLPFIGDRTDIDGSILEHDIRAFEFTNQSGETISNSNVDGKIYMTDFFFISCPTICPRVKKQMLRLYDKVEDNKDILLLSHTVDPKRDSVGALKIYADNLSVDHDRWWFLTGDKDELLDIADDYFIAAYEDEDAPGGFDHSGKIILVDKEGRIRSFCDGTDPESVDKMMKDIDQLIASYE